MAVATKNVVMPRQLTVGQPVCACGVETLQIFKNKNILSVHTLYNSVLSVDYIQY